MTADPLSGGRFVMKYRLTGCESFARTLSEEFCADQTIESPIAVAH